MGTPETSKHLPMNLMVMILPRCPAPAPKTSPLTSIPKTSKHLPMNSLVMILLRSPTVAVTVLPPAVTVPLAPTVLTMNLLRKREKERRRSQNALQRTRLRQWKERRMSSTRSTKTKADRSMNKRENSLLDALSKPACCPKKKPLQLANSLLALPVMTTCSPKTRPQQPSKLLRRLTKNESSEHSNTCPNSPISLRDVADKSGSS